MKITLALQMRVGQCVEDGAPLTEGDQQTKYWWKTMRRQAVEHPQNSYKWHKLPKVGFLDILNLCVVPECVELESGVGSSFILFMEELLMEAVGSSLSSRL